jgi:DNA-binding LacI/PurR family transcriptional regulator
LQFHREQAEHRERVTKGFNSAMAKKSDRVTIKTVAADADVSVATVSKVVRKAHHVSPRLRAKVSASIERLGYRPHTAARGMRGQTFTLGVLLGDIRNPFFPDILDGMLTELDRTEYKALLGIGRASAPVEMAMFESMLDRQMDGVIMVAPRMPPAAIEKMAAKCPTVVIGYHQPDATTFDTVNGNDRIGAQLVVNHLVGRGHKRIAFVGTETSGIGDGGIMTERTVGFRDAMESHGLKEFIDVRVFPEHVAQYKSAISEMLALSSRPTAVFCTNDTLAMEVLSCATDLGISVPSEVAVVGYDNIKYGDYSYISLSSVDQSGEILGLQAARLLIERIKGRSSAEHFVFPPRLVARHSSVSQTPGFSSDSDN